jgi:hypothetical protein
MHYRERLLAALATWCGATPRDPDAQTHFEWQDDAWDVEDFDRMASVLASLTDVRAEPRPEALRALHEGAGWTLVVEGADNIATYRRTSNAALVPHRWELRELVDAVELPRAFAPARLRAVRVRTHAGPPPALPSGDAVVCRLRKELRHTHPVTAISYVLCMERESNCSMAADLVSLRVELPAGRDEPAATLLQHGLRLGAVGRNEPALMTAAEQRRVLAAYGQLVAQAKRAQPKGAQLRPVDAEPFFMAPKPVTLERVHLVDPEARFGAVTIQREYAVTDKADGERMLLYIDNDGQAYLINSALEVTATGAHVRSANLHSTLLDGEFLAAHGLRTAGRRNIFAAFDIYFLAGKCTINRPLFAEQRARPNTAGARGGAADFAEGRYDLLKSALAPGMWDASRSNLELVCKVHRRADGRGIFCAAAEALADAERAPWHNDGLVFTPTRLHVWGVYPNGRTVNVVPEMTGWDRVLKWKPAEQNSIDFLVRDTGVEVPGGRRQFQLLCGYNVAKATPLTVREGLRLLADARGRAEHALALRDYAPAAFEPASYIAPDADKAWLEAGEVEDETIVECRYLADRTDLAPPLRWRVMRVRKDKTRLYRASGNISRAANDMRTARNIWVSLHEPVTRAMILGREVVANDAGVVESGVDERYYARDIPRYHLLSVNMQNFHNLVVKRCLFERPPPSRRRRLLELACGQAGDLPRWTAAGYASVVGIDKNKNNIQDVANGAYARALRQASGAQGRVPACAFLVGDCAERFEGGKAFEDESAEVWRDLQRPQPPEPLAAFAGKRLEFDVVSCQFALHYFVKSATTLSTFLANVADRLADGGYFLATFMDGETVHRRLRRAQRGVLKGEVAGATVWALQAQYSSFDQAADDVYGKQIGVYLENTRQTIAEYLVPFEVLKARAADVGLTLEASETFDETFDRERREAKDGSMAHVFERLRREPVQRAFSGFNRWVVFRKHG